jgi:hypothetical protein
VGKKKSKQPRNRKTALWYLGELLRLAQASNDLLREIASRLPFIPHFPIAPPIILPKSPLPTTPVYGVNQPPIVVMYGCNPIWDTNKTMPPHTLHPMYGVKVTSTTQESSDPITENNLVDIDGNKLLDIGLGEGSYHPPDDLSIGSRYGPPGKKK